MDSAQFVSRIERLFGSPDDEQHKKGAPKTLGTPLIKLLDYCQSVVIRECCLVSFMVAYTSSEQAMHAVTYQ